MSYRIQYPVIHKLRSRTRLRLPAMTALCFLVFLVAVNLLWPEGAAYLKAAVPVAALDRLASELMGEMDVLTCLSDFMNMILP